MPRALCATLVMLALNTSLCLAQHASANQRPEPAPKTVSSPTSLEDSEAELELLDLANQSRRDAGAPLLRLDESLRNAARAHARLMVERQQLSHQFDGEPSLMPRLLETGLRLDRVGENVAYNANVEKAFKALMQSPPHRRNLLDAAFNSVGFAAFWSNGRLYVVQDFARQLSSISRTSSP